VSELEARFGESNAALASSLECLWRENQAFLQMSKLTAITDLIEIKESSLAVSECEVARQMIAKEFNPECHKDLGDVCRILFPLRAAFPNVYSIYAAALTFGMEMALTHPSHHRTGPLTLKLCCPLLCTVTSTWSQMITTC